MNEYSLTTEQKKIVELNHGQHLVLAAPGTGKTELLVNRLANAIDLGIKHDEMICLTFTNRAAKNMSDRIEKNIGEHDIFIGNIHSYCQTFLKKFKLIPHNTSLLDDEDSKLLMEECKTFSSFNIHELLELNSYLKQKSFNFDSSLMKAPKKYYDAFEEESCEMYEKIKKESNFIDFDDLLTLTYKYLKENEDLFLDRPIKKWIQVDEVQDLNPLQWAIIDKLSNKTNSHRVFFGDIEQSIFSFMGAKIEVLNEVAKECRVHELQNNFRSPQYLLDLYNTYAKALLNPKWLNEPKSLNKNYTPLNPLEYKEINGSEENELEWITDNKLSFNKEEESTAVLVRTNKTADLISKKLDIKNIKHFKISGFDVFKRKIVKDVLSFLNIIINNSDKNSWIRVLSLYGKLQTFGTSRNMINKMISLGLNPLDFTNSKQYKESFLDDFDTNLNQERIVVFDTETTGLDTKNDDIIQIAAIEIINGKIGEVFEVYIDTEKNLGDSEKTHKISKAFLVKNSTDKSKALNSFVDFVGEDILIAHNLRYDYEILNSNLKSMNMNEMIHGNTMLYDTIDIAKRLYPNLSSYKLEYLLNELNVEGKNSHNALDDVKATVNLISFLSKNISINKDSRINFIKENSKKLQTFKEKFSPIYEAIQSNFSNKMSMEEIFDMIISYKRDHLNYKLSEEEFNEIDKIKKHMNVKCKLGEVLKIIGKYTPEYAKYNESDLILGNEKIIIATIHKAKGLEFDNVIITGCTDDNFPSYWSKQSGEKSILEDARVLYVAMTRAKKSLLFTSANVGKWEKKQISSRFLRPIYHLLKSN